MTRSSVTVALVAWIALSVGCAAGLETRRIGTADKAEVDGLAANVGEPHGIVALFRKEPGKGDIVVQRAGAMLPSPTELYEVNYDTALFRSVTLDVEFHADSTLKRVKLDSQQQAPEALETLSGALGEAQETIAKLMEAEAQREAAAAAPGPHPLTGANAELELRLKNLMLQANIDALGRGDPLPYPPQE